MKHTLRKGGLMDLRKFLIHVSLRSLCRLALADICAQRILWSFGYDYGVESVISFVSNPKLLKVDKKMYCLYHCQPLATTGPPATICKPLAKPRTTCDHLRARGLQVNTTKDGDHYRPLASLGPRSTTT